MRNRPSVKHICLMTFLCYNNLAWSSCDEEKNTEANQLVKHSINASDPLESTSFLMKALLLCKKYEWWMRLGESQGAQKYWHEAADAYKRARYYYQTKEPEKSLNKKQIEHQAVAGIALSEAYLFSENEAEALIALDESRLMFSLADTPLPDSFITLQRKIDDLFSDADSALLTRTINLQISGINRGIGVRAKISNNEKNNSTSVNSVSDTSQKITIEPTYRISLQVLFATGRSDLNADSRLMIKRIAAAIDNTNLKDGDRVLVVGHTDAVGSSQRNQNLSERRANSVRAGIQKELEKSVELIAIGRGENNLRYPENSIDANRRNRRVELVVEK